MSRCPFPEHHQQGQGHGAGAPAGLLIVIALTAEIVTHWRDFIIGIVTTTCVLIAAGVAGWLFRNHGSGYDPELERQVALDCAQTPRVAAASATPAQSSAAVPAAATAAIEATPTVVYNHQHLHLHGISNEQLAAVVTRQADQPAIQDGHSR